MKEKKSEEEGGDRCKYSKDDSLFNVCVAQIPEL